MNNPFRIIFYGLIVSLAIVAMTSVAHGFDDKTTHPALTKAIVDEYNRRHPDAPISSEFRDALMKGSVLEDTPPRWVNHFYDPITKTGWTGRDMGMFSSSTVRAFSDLFVSPEKPRATIEWVHDDALQDAYALYGGNHTWVQGLREYAAGNTAQAFESVGHTLHLLEDMGVPDHVRDDTHAHVLESLTGDVGSPHELHDALLSSITITIAASSSIPRYKKIQDYFIDLATYVNTHFFSKDTIQDSRYALPKIAYEDNQFAYGLDEVGIRIPIASVEHVLAPDGSIQKTYRLLDRETYAAIFDAHFAHVAPRIVLAGVGALELFLAQGAEAKANPDFLPAKSSWISRLTTPLFSVVGLAAKAKTGIQQLLGNVSTIQNVTTTVVIAPSAARTATSAIVIAPQPKAAAPATTTTKPSTSAKPKTVATSTIVVPKVLPKSTPVSPKPTSTVPKAAATSSAPTNPAPQIIVISSIVPTVPPPEPPVFGTIMISEIQVAGTSDANDEFIELYNPNDFDVPIAHWSIQYLSGAADSFAQVKKRNFEDGMLIESHRYFLVARGLNSSGEDGYRGVPVADMTQRTFSLSGAATGGAVFLVKNQEVISGADDADIVDAAGYGANTLTPVRIATPGGGKSIERKALRDDQCIPASDPSAQLAGNGCDRDGVDDFDIRDASDPQNSASDLEPRAGDAAAEDGNGQSEKFSVSYATSSGSAVFVWSAYEGSETTSTPYTYRIFDSSSASTSSLVEVVSAATSSFEYHVPLSDVGRSYQFALRISQNETEVRQYAVALVVPGMLRDARFYADPRTEHGYLADFFYDQIPFIPSRFSAVAGDDPNWQGMVVYRNRLPNTENTTLTTTDGLVVQHPDGVVAMNVLGGAHDSIIFSVRTELIPSSAGGLAQMSFQLPREDNHLELLFAVPAESEPLTPADYFTIAFYDFSRVGGGSQDLTLVAIDETKYYFSSSTPAHSVPAAPADFSATVDGPMRAATFAWARSIDPDTEDTAVTYDFAFATSSDAIPEWQHLGTALTTTISLATSGPYVAWVRARDDFGGVSSSTQITGDIPPFPHQFPDQQHHDVVVGRSDMHPEAAERIFIPNDMRLAGVSLWIGQLIGSSCCTDTALEIRADADGSLGDVIATSPVVRTGRNISDQENFYPFDAVPLTANTYYWLRPVYAGLNQAQYFGSDTDTYSDGVWSVDSRQDLYFKLLLVVDPPAAL